jgi:hypothetical protein
MELFLRRYTHTYTRCSSQRIVPKLKARLDRRIIQITRYLNNLASLQIQQQVFEQGKLANGGKTKAAAPIVVPAELKSGKQSTVTQFIACIITTTGVEILPDSPTDIVPLLQVDEEKLGK